MAEIFKGVVYKNYITHLTFQYRLFQTIVIIM